MLIPPFLAVDPDAAVGALPFLDAFSFTFVGKYPWVRIFAIASSAVLASIYALTSWPAAFIASYWKTAMVDLLARQRAIAAG